MLFITLFIALICFFEYAFSILTVILFNESTSVFILVNELYGWTKLFIFDKVF